MIWGSAILVPRHVDIHLHVEAPSVPLLTLTMDDNRTDLNTRNGWMALDLVNRESHHEFRRLTAWRIAGHGLRYRTSLTELDHVVLTTYTMGEVPAELGRLARWISLVELANDFHILDWSLPESLVAAFIDHNLN